jgi:hypothetical protein
LGVLKENLSKEYSKFPTRVNWDEIWRLQLVAPERLESKSEKITPEKCLEKKGGKGDSNGIEIGNAEEEEGESMTHEAREKREDGESLPLRELSTRSLPRQETKSYFENLCSALHEWLKEFVEEKERHGFVDPVLRFIRQEWK